VSETRAGKWEETKNKVPYRPPLYTEFVLSPRRLWETECLANMRFLMYR
jgi:hypothetical protein